MNTGTQTTIVNKQGERINDETYTSTNSDKSTHIRSICSRSDSDNNNTTIKWAVVESKAGIKHIIRYRNELVRYRFDGETMIIERHGHANPDSDHIIIGAYLFELDADSNEIIISKSLTDINNEKLYRQYFRIQGIDVIEGRNESYFTANEHTTGRGASCFGHFAKYGVYIHIPDGSCQCYVGRAKDLYSRWYSNEGELTQYDHNHRFNNVIKNKGADNIKTLWVDTWNYDGRTAGAMEADLINTLNTYNIQKKRLDQFDRQELPN